MRFWGSYRWWELRPKTALEPACGHECLGETFLTNAKIRTGKFPWCPPALQVPVFVHLYAEGVTFGAPHYMRIFSQAPPLASPWALSSVPTACQPSTGKMSSPGSAVTVRGKPASALNSLPRFLHWFYFLIFCICNALIPGALLILERDCPSGLANNSFVRVPFIDKPANPEPILWTTIWLFYSGSMFLCPNHPRANYQTLDALRQSLHPRACWNYSN